MQDAMWAFMFLSFFALAATAVINNVSRLKRVDRTKAWPSVEATVESGRLEMVHHVSFHDVPMPVFELSYVVDEKPYRDRFGLSMVKEPPESLIGKMIGRRIMVQYDPQNPASCFIPSETMEGCRIEQRIGSLVRFYAKQ